jgi:hypothetical protein
MLYVCCDCCLLCAVCCYLLLLLLAVRRGPRAVLFREGEDQLGAVTNRGSAASNKIGRTRSITYPMSTIVIPIPPLRLYALLCGWVSAANVRAMI